jgi:hypothetical protein
MLPLQRGQVMAISDVAQRNADITQKTSTFDSLDRGMAEQSAELKIVQSQEVAQWHLGHWPCGKSCFS